MGRSGAAPLLRAEHKADSQKWLSHSCGGAVAFFVFFAGAAGAWIVAAYFGAGSDWLGRFGLGGSGLILQIFLLALLAALDLSGDFRETLRLAFAGTGGSAGDRGLRSTRAASRKGRLLRLGPGLHVVGMALRLLHLDVEEIADGFVVDAGHHVFEEHEGFFLEFDQGIFLAVAAQADAFFQMVEGEKVIFPLRIDHVENNAALEPAHQLGSELLFLFVVALGDSFYGGFRKLVVA